jgi:hypothetical protein
MRFAGGRRRSPRPGIALDKGGGRAQPPLRAYGHLPPLLWIAPHRRRGDHTQGGNDHAEAHKKKGARRDTKRLRGQRNREHPRCCGTNNRQ